MQYYKARNSEGRIPVNLRKTGEEIVALPNGSQRNTLSLIHKSEEPWSQEVVIEVNRSHCSPKMNDTNVGEVMNDRIIAFTLRTASTFYTPKRNDEGPKISQMSTAGISKSPTSSFHLRSCAAIVKSTRRKERSFKNR